LLWYQSFYAFWRSSPRLWQETCQPCPALPQLPRPTSRHAYGKKGILEKAISNFTEAIPLDANNASAYYNRGLAYSKRRNLNKANGDFATAKRLKAGQ
jgi:tetratricopeptide (TPR) repeat protein